MIKWHSLLFLITVVFSTALFSLNGMYYGLRHQSPYSDRNSVIYDEIPVLYPSIEWHSSKEENVGFRPLVGKIKYAEGHRFESKGLKTYPNNFIAYYSRELKKKGWIKVTHINMVGGDLYVYSKVSNLYDMFMFYFFGDPLEEEERHFQFGVLLPGWTKHPGQYQAFIEYSIPSISNKEDE